MTRYKVQYLLIAGVIFLVGLVGAVFLIQRQTQLESRAADATTLYFEPQTTASNPLQEGIDDPITLDIMLDPGTQLVSIVKIDITFDPTFVRPIVQSAFLPNTQAFPEMVQQPVIGTNKISAVVSIGANPTKAVNTVTKVATIQLQPLSGTDANTPTQVVFTTQSQVFSLSEDVAHNQNVLSETSPVYIALSAAGSVTGGPIPPGVVYATSCTADLQVRDKDVDSKGSGKATILLSQDGTKGLVSVEYKRLTGNAKNVVIRGPVDGDKKGPKQFSLPATPFSNYAITLSATQLKQLKNEKYTVDVQTKKYALGEIWGRIRNCKAIPRDGASPTVTTIPSLTDAPPPSPSPKPNLPTYSLTCSADLKDKKDNQPNNKRATGKATVRISADRTKALVTLSYKRLGDKAKTVGIYGPGKFGQDKNVPLVFTLPNRQFANHEIPLTTSQVQTFIDGMYFLNVTTKGEPGSALRGQFSGCKEVQNDPSATAFTLDLFLHGIGRGGDNADPASGGNPNPIHPIRLASVEVFDTNNASVLQADTNVTYDAASGSFKGTLPIGSLQNGNYTVKVKVNKYLQRQAPNIYTINNGFVTALPPLRLTVGDIIGDNKLNIQDFNALAGCYRGVAPPSACQGQLSAQSADESLDTLIDESDLNAADSQQFNQNEASDINDDGIVNEPDLSLYIRELTTRLGSNE